MTRYELNKEYLICELKEITHADKNIIKIMIVSQTEKCFKIKYESGKEKWIEKEVLNNSYHKIEDLGFKILIKTEHD